MSIDSVDVAVIGGGPAGMAAALAAWTSGVRDIRIFERDEVGLGGILNQCIHNGFGLHWFKEELTGPEYAERFSDQIAAAGIEVELGTMVLDLDQEKTLTLVNPRGLRRIRAKAVVLAMGCRERPRGALSIPGTRPAGIFSAGTAQKFVNLDGMMPGSDVVVLGSGDIGLIMARRLTLEGARVRAVVEVLPFSGGLKRNIVQCLDDFGIPLLLSHTITRIYGKERVSGVDIAKVDSERKPLPETVRHIACDTLLLSVGLTPENELSKEAGVALSAVAGGPVVGSGLQTSLDGVFACGNVLHVYDLVDFVSREAEKAGRNAAAYVQGKRFSGETIPLTAGEGVRYTVPFCATKDDVARGFSIMLRVGAVYVDKRLAVYAGDTLLYAKKHRILTPGEMTTLDLPHNSVAGLENIASLDIRVEEAT